MIYLIIGPFFLPFFFFDSFSESKSDSGYGSESSPSLAYLKVTLLIFSTGAWPFEFTFFSGNIDLSYWVAVTIIDSAYSCISYNYSLTNFPMNYLASDLWWFLIASTLSIDATLDEDYTFSFNISIVW